jgi:hypothetical protein
MSIVEQIWQPSKMQDGGVHTLFGKRPRRRGQLRE